MIAKLAVLAALLSGAAAATAQDRPSEEEMFAGPKPPSPEASKPPGPAGGGYAMLAIGFRL